MPEQSENEGTEQSEKRHRENGKDTQSNRKKALSNRTMAASNWKQLPMQSGTTGRANVDNCRVISVCNGSRMHFEQYKQIGFVKCQI